MSEPAPLTPAVFDRVFTQAAESTWLRDTFNDLPPEVDPFSFVTLDGLREIVDHLQVAPGALLVDLACGRGGPGLWVAGALQARLVGVDWSPVGIEHARQRATQLAPGIDVRYLVADATVTTLPDAYADGLLCVDAIQLMADPDAVMHEVARVLKPGARAVFTTWDGDTRLPDVARLFAAADLTPVAIEERPAWLERERRIFERARADAPQSDDPGCKDLAEEAEYVLPMLERSRRVIAVAERRADPAHL